MSRNFKYVFLGSLWTVATVTFFAGHLLPMSPDAGSAAALALALMAPILLFALAGVTESSAARWSAVALHLALPFLWTAQQAYSAGVFIDNTALFWVGFTTIVGCTVSDLALDLNVTSLNLGSLFFNEEEERRRAEAAVKTLGVFESGGFRPQLACDSGAFKSL